MFNCTQTADRVRALTIEEIEEIVADHAARLDAQDLDNEQDGGPPAPAESDNRDF